MEMSLFDMFDNMEYAPLPQNGETSPADDKGGDSADDASKSQNGAEMGAEESENKETAPIDETTAAPVADNAFVMTEFKQLACPYCKKQPSIRANITDKMPMDDPERYTIPCCSFTAHGISETQVIYNWNKMVLKALKKL